MQAKITHFDAEFAFLSNFYPCNITYEGITYLSSEAAFQAAKTTDITIKKSISQMQPSASKRIGRRLILRDDWELIKIQVMTDILNIKFSTLELKNALLTTQGFTLIEGNWWHDNFWGDCWCDKCKQITGQNNLGKLLMNIRTNIQTNEKNICK